MLLSDHLDDFVKEQFVVVHFWEAASFRIYHRPVLGHISLGNARIWHTSAAIACFYSKAGPDAQANFRRTELAGSIQPTGVLLGLLICPSIQ